MVYTMPRANGWQIGSGPLGAACKAIIGLRLKGTGEVRSGPHKADGESHLRARFKSERGPWTAYWVHGRVAD
jgi:hypothetical protein